MPIVGAAFLLAVGRALARIHVEYDGLRRSPLMHLVDPLAPGRSARAASHAPENGRSTSESGCAGGQGALPRCASNGN
jgi:hypothetical protein